MAENPLAVFERLDPELLKMLGDNRQLAFADGALPRKSKLLIAMALDAAHGASEGVGSLARQALKAGATKQEIAETLRIAHLICGAGSIYTAAQGLKGLF